MAQMKMSGKISSRRLPMIRNYCLAWKWTMLKPIELRKMATLEEGFQIQELKET